MKFSARANNISFRCGFAFSLEKNVSTLIFGLQGAVQTIVADETEELDDKRQMYKSVIQMTRKEGKAYRVRRTISTLSQKTSYASQLHENDEAFIIYR